MKITGTKEEIDQVFKAINDRRKLINRLYIAAITITIILSVAAAYCEYLNQPQP